MSKHRWRILGWGFALALLAAPAVAMQFTGEVKWGPGSFAVFGAMLAALGAGIELAVRQSRDAAYRIAAAIALVAGFLMVWANLAVGFIGSEDNPANLMFFAILAIGAVGALIARMRPAGLSRTLGAMAFAQTGAGVAAVTLFAARTPEWAICFVFAGLWLLSAWLFGKAGDPQGRPAAA